MGVVTTVLVGAGGLVLGGGAGYAYGMYWCGKKTLGAIRKFLPWATDLSLNETLAIVSAYMDKEKRRVLVSSMKAAGKILPTSKQENILNDPKFWQQHFENAVKAGMGGDIQIIQGTTIEELLKKKPSSS